MELRDAQTSAEDLIASVEATIAEKRGRQKRLDQEHAAIGVEIADMEALAARLRAAVAPHEVGTTEKAMTIEPDGEWRRLTRPDAIERLLRQSPPLGPKEILDELHARGRTDTYEGVASCLHKMAKRRGTIERIGWGQWTMVDRADALARVVPIHSGGAPNA